MGGETAIAAAVGGGNVAAAGPISAMLDDFLLFVDRSEKTARTYMTNLRQFMAWLNYAEVLRPVRADIISYRQWLTVEHDAISLAPGTAAGYVVRRDRFGAVVRVACKPTTVKAYLQSVKAFFSWTAAAGLYPNVAENIHAPKIPDNHKKDSFTAAEVLAIERSICDSIPPGGSDCRTEQGKRLLAMYLLAVNAGMRTVELSRANVKDIETKGGVSYIYIWGKGRNSADQKKPIAREVRAAIDDYLGARSDNPTGASPLFVSTGNRSGGKRIATTTISTMLKNAMRAAGFDSDRLTAHSLRHSAARGVMEVTGNNIYNAQQYMRHASPKTTEIYLDNDSTAQDERIARQLYRHYHVDDTERTALEQLTEAAATLSHEKQGRLLEFIRAEF